MTYADELVEQYRHRTGQPGDMQLDATWQYQWTFLRDLLGRLEVILGDEDVPRDVAVRVLRCLLYGSPSRADAEERMRTHQEMAELLARMPVMPVTGVFSPDALGRAADGE